jgi:hypothetical protein
MNHRLTVVMLAAALAAGCGKKTEDKPAVAAKEEPQAPPAGPSFMTTTTGLGFCDEGDHVDENIKLVGGSPYGLLVRGTCKMTLKHCTIIAAADADQPAVQVMENAVVRFEDCTLVSKNPKFPALWVSAGGKATLVKTRLESPMETAVDVWENSTVEHYDSSWTGTPNVRDTGKLTKLDAMPQ